MYWYRPDTASKRPIWYTLRERDGVVVYCRPTAPEMWHRSVEYDTARDLDEAGYLRVAKVGDTFDTDLQMAEGL